MSWFSDKKNTKIDLHRTLARVLNTTTSVGSHLHVDDEQEQRLDSRIQRMMPVVILPLNQPSDKLQLSVGITQDVSCEGMLVATLGSLQEETEFAVGIGKGEDFAVIQCKCVRSKPIGFGYYSGGLQAVEVLSLNEFAALKEFADYLEANPPANSLELSPS